MNTIYGFCESKLNININWVDVLYEYEDDIYNLDNYNKDEQLRKRINKLLKKIKNLSWCDNPTSNAHAMEPTNDDEHHKDKQIEEIINIFMANDYRDKSIGILSPNEKQTQTTNKYEYYKMLANKVYTIGNIFGFSCNVISTVNDLNENDIILPISSLTLSKQDVDKIDVSKIVFPTVHDYNIILDDGNKHNKQCYDFIHLVDNFVKHDEIIKRDYAYIIVPCENNENTHERSELGT